MSNDDNDMIVDEHGNALPSKPGEVKRFAEKALEEGTIEVAIIRMPNGDLSVQVYGPPSKELLDVLETAARGYKRALAGH